MTQKYKSIRATIQGEHLIDQYEKYKFDNELTDRQIISMALAQFLNQREQNELYDNDI